jgi:hypothetical protein
MYEPPMKIILKCLESKWDENNFQSETKNISCIFLI